MRFLGNLGFTAVSDYAGKSEEDENRFLAEAFGAMRADIAGHPVANCRRGEHPEG